MTLNRCSILFAALTMIIALGSVHEARAERRQPLDSAQIRQVMSKHLSAVRKCYVEHSMPAKNAKGVVTLDMLVRAGGQVAAIEVETDGAKDVKFERCVSKLATRWRFPKSAYQTRVKYPMMFLHTRAGRGPSAPARGKGGASDEQGSSPSRK